MRKIVLSFLVLFSLGFTNIQAKESILAEPDFDNSIVFYTWDTSTSTDMRGTLLSAYPQDPIFLNVVFHKYIDANDNIRYWIRIDSPDEKKYLQNGYLFIDDETYPLQQIDQWSRLLLMSGRYMIERPYYPVNFAFYDISEELMKKIAETEPQSKIILMFERTQRPLGMRLGKKFRSKITTLSQVTRDDYDQYKIKDKKTVEKKKEELSQDAPVLTLDQMKNPNRY